MDTYSPVVSEWLAVASIVARRSQPVVLPATGATLPSYDWQTVSLQQLKTKALQQYAAQIRSLARTRYRKSGRPQACAVCGYNVHYEVCHIKPINEFLPADFVADVNRLGNLVALCPNHHWEYDHGLLTPAFIAATIENQLEASSAKNRKLLPIGNSLL